ncbi:hypothetical protein [Streptomyces triticirhizae]|uniref:hypothetical protein n=1 Tax=Streptomyces triticirhizae TaxID=2483353 RepID=UPI001315949A|nr:hypothetical protein [Streptomyces triticirhizae]
MLIYLHDGETDLPYDGDDPLGLVAEFERIAGPQSVAVLTTGLDTDFLAALGRVAAKVG